MSIQGLVNTPARPGSRPAAARRTAPSRASFQSRLARTAASAAADPGIHLHMPGENTVYSGAPAGDAAVLDRGALLREDPLAALNEARLLLLRRTREGREWKKEQEEWDRLMRCLDGWIDALRDAAEQRREGRSCSVTEEGGEAVLSMYRNLVTAAARAESAGVEPARSGEDLLSALTAAQSELLERLKEDRAAEEEREDWAELLRRLDRWIEALRGAEDREEDGRRPEPVSAAAAGPQDQYKA